MISLKCPLILPHHIEIDKKLNSSQKKEGLAQLQKELGPLIVTSHKENFIGF